MHSPIPAPDDVVPKRIVICDLDGTLALGEHRLHFIDPRTPQGLPDTTKKQDWDSFYEACDQDDPNWPIIYMVRILEATGHKIIIVTGRSAKVGQKTMDWLKNFKVPYHGLFMRQEGDFQPDHAMKKKWYEAYCEANAVRPGDVSFVLEDRTQVVKMWRELGLTCLQVANGDF